MIAILIDSIERYYFFARLIPSLQTKYSVVIITADPLAYFFSKQFSCWRILIKKKNLSVIDDFYLQDAEKNIIGSIDLLNNYYSSKKAKEYYFTSIALIDSFFKEHKISKCVIWNGQKLLSKAMIKVCDKFNVDTVFLEIANLPNKMFADSYGVNAASEIFFNINVIDKLPYVSDSIHQDWMIMYEKSKKIKLPQSQTNIKKKIIQIINYLLKFYTRSYRSYIRFGNVQNSIDISSMTDAISSVCTNDYIFLALQVSSDTQIKLNSDINNIDAIHYAANRAKELGLKLVVKVHPAENDKKEILKILHEKNKLGFQLAFFNTIELIKNSKEVIVINSTVGLESLFYNKKIIVLGRSFYTNFDHERLKKYVHHYLIDGIDYFSDEMIPLSLCEKLFLIADNQVL